MKPGKKWFKKIYIAILLWVVGRAIQVAARVDKNLKEEFDNFPENFMFSLGVLPNGPFCIVGKDKKGRAKYMGWNTTGKKLTLRLGIKNIEAAFLVLSFQESTTVAFAHDRFIVDGDVAEGLAIVRILDMVEVYLLPWPIARLAVKRYPKWSELNPLKKWLLRVVIYVRAFTF